MSFFFDKCSGEEGLRPQAPVKPQRNRKAMSYDTGTVSVFRIALLLFNRLLHNMFLFMLVICVYIYIYVELCLKHLYLTVNWCSLSSLNSGTDRESPNNIEKPPNRKPPVKKPRLPQNRNKSLDLSGTCLSVFIYMCVCVHAYL